MAVELDGNRMLVTDGRQSQMALDIQRGVGRMLTWMDAVERKSQRLMDPEFG